MNCPRCGTSNVQGRATCCICFAPLRETAPVQHNFQNIESTPSPKDHPVTSSTVPTERPAFMLPEQPARPMTYPPSSHTVEHRSNPPISFDRLDIPNARNEAMDTEAIAPPSFAQSSSGILPPKGVSVQQSSQPAQPTAMQPEQLQQLRRSIGRSAPESEHLNGAVESTPEVTRREPGLSSGALFSAVGHQPQKSSIQQNAVQPARSLPRPRLEKHFVFAPKVSLPSLFRRLLAGGVDITLVATVAFLITWIAGPKMTHPFPTGLHGIDLLATVLQRYTPQVSFFIITFMATVFVYTTLLHALRGQTVGKMVAGLQVIDRSGGSFSILGAFARSLAFLLFFALGLVGLTWILFDKEYRALHDRLSGSLVIRVPPSS